MQQLDMFPEMNDIYLYGEIEKVKNSMDRRSRAMFAIIAELQDAILKLKEEKNHQ